MVFFEPIILFMCMNICRHDYNCPVFLCLGHSFQDDKFSVDVVTRPLANNVEFRHETSQPTAGIISNIAGPGSSRSPIPSQSMEHLMLLEFYIMVVKIYAVFSWYLSQPCLRTWFAWTSGQA